MSYYTLQKTSYFQIKNSGYKFLIEWKIVMADSYLLRIMDIVLDGLKR